MFDRLPDQFAKQAKKGHQACRYGFGRSKHVVWTRRETPGKLFALAFALYALAPAAVYMLPDDSTPLLAAQIGAVALGALGGTAAYAGATLLANLQKD